MGCAWPTRPGGRPRATPAPDWAGLQARADDLTQELYALRESAPGEEERAQVEDALGSLQALRSAMAPGPAAPAPGSPQAAQIHSRLLAFDAAIRDLREPVQLPRSEPAHARRRGHGAGCQPVWYRLRHEQTAR